MDLVQVEDVTQSLKDLGLGELGQCYMVLGVDNVNKRRYTIDTVNSNQLNEVRENDPSKTPPDHRKNKDID